MKFLKSTSQNSKEIFSYSEVTEKGVSLKKESSLSKEKLPFSSEKTRNKNNGFNWIKLIILFLLVLIPIGVIALQTTNNNYFEKSNYIDDNLTSEFIVNSASNISNLNIIEIVKAEHLDSQGNFISDIYDSVKEKDNIWSESIEEGDYVRVTFEKNLTSRNDITIYSRTISGNPVVEVYEINGNEKIAEFSMLNSDQYNKIILTNLQASQDSFDLRVLNGTIELDNIIDPSGYLIPTGYVSWWRFEQGNGTFFAEATGLNNGTCTGAVCPTFNATGKYGGGYEFDGIDDYVDAGNNPVLDPINNLSISLWIRPYKPTTTCYLISKGPDDAINGQFGFVLSSTINFEIRQNNVWNQVLGTTTINPNSWYHVLGTWNGSTMRLYINGVEEGTPKILAGPLTVNNGNLQIGRLGKPGFLYQFNGSIDEVLIYNRSLNSSEISQLYQMSSYDGTKKMDTGATGNATSSTYTNRFISGNQPVSSYTSGSFSGRFGVLDDSANTAPQINYISSIAAQDPVEASPRPITFYVTMSDPDGVSDLNDASISANFTRPGEALRQNSSCKWLNDIDALSANYSCTIDMWYWDENGDWNISVQGKDSVNPFVQNLSTRFTYNELKALVISPTALTWPSILPGAKNQTSNNDPTTINNTGNYNLTGQIAVKGIDLYGESRTAEFIGVANFTVSVNTGGNPPLDCLGTSLANATDRTITGVILERGNLSAGQAQEGIYYCMQNVPSTISSQVYSTTTGGSWIIKILLSFVITPRRKKKEKEALKQKGKQKVKETKDSLLQALNLVTEELKKSYSEEKATIINLLAKEIGKEQNLNKKEIGKLIEVRQDIEIPITIFSKEIGALESVVKYLKENINLSYHEIAELLDRDDRTIWTAYHKAIKKNNKPFEIKQSDKKLPCSVLVSNNLTILESVVFHLKNQGLKYSEIAEIIGRDQRNIWVTYSNANKKLKGSRK